MTNIINHTKNKNHIKSESGKYLIVCTGCDISYIDETSRLIKKHIYKHPRHFKIGDKRNALVKQYFEIKYGFNFKMLVNIHNKELREIVESSIILNYNTVKGCFFHLIFLFS